MKGWFTVNCNWSEVFLPGLPSTSNNIESFYINNLKNKGKLKNRLPTIHFLNNVETVIYEWSLDRDPLLFDKATNTRNIPNPNLREF